MSDHVSGLSVLTWAQASLRRVDVRQMSSNDATMGVTRRERGAGKWAVVSGVPLELEVEGGPGVWTFGDPSGKKEGGMTSDAL